MDDARKRLIGTAVILLAAVLIVLLALPRSPENEEPASETAAPTATVEATLPLPWPVKPFTDAQIAEVRRCSFFTSDYTPVPSTVPDLTQPHPEFTTCRWARIAAAQDDEISEADRVTALEKALTANPAFALSPALTNSYFGEIALVESPPFVRSAVVAVTLHYDFSGEAYYEEYDVSISDANTKPQVSGEASDNNETLSQPITGIVRLETVQAIGDALDNLLPVEHRFRIDDCCDYYPDWQVMIQYQDGHRVFATTNVSNRLGGGGPWQIVVNGRNYLQYSPDLISAAVNIFVELNIFEPDNYLYFELFDPPGDPLFNYAFP
jgi:hypothetical protein